MKHRRDAGFSLAALIFFATALSILMAAAVPAYQIQAKRALEEELIFRGEEYTRAIQKYQRKFGVYPTSVDQLVQTNGLRFVRKKYKDPITDKEFRLILLNPDMTLTGSKTIGVTNKPLFGNIPIFNSGAGPNSPPKGPPTSPSPASPAGPASPIPANTLSSQPTGQRGTPFTGGSIVGVASDSSKESLKIYNQHQKYDEWEFFALVGQPGGPGGVGGPGVTGFPGQGNNGFGGQGNNGFGGQGNNGFGGGGNGVPGAGNGFPGAGNGFPGAGNGFPGAGNPAPQQPNQPNTPTKR